VGWLAIVLSAFASPLAVPAGNTEAPTATDARLNQLGPGDGLSFRVYGQPDMDSTVVVGEDGTIPVPLAGPVKVSGLSPAEAAKQVEKALRNGGFLRKPIVTLTVTDARSQRVSVLGEVGTPGRYSIDSRTTIFDLLAEAGGIKETGSDTIYVLRTAPDGSTERFAVETKRLVSDPGSKSVVLLRAGDSVYVPRAEQFFVYGEVNAPNNYRFEPGMTVLEAIARAGGLTPRGSDRRVEIRRQNAQGTYSTRTGRLADRVLANDVIRVKERIF
jgi:polysaccharide export outer membrane protein